jgi:transcriptional regulator with PAS, ATPase and Fis domain
MKDQAEVRKGSLSSSEFAERRGGAFVGRSIPFCSIFETISSVALRKSSVIITGETGTGKEMVARQIHAMSERAGKVFVPVDCTALHGQIFESQLFGHMKGSFTGAASDTLGFFRAANEGTIFLDEIGEIEVGLQSKLLRVLQESCVVPVGSTKAYSVDVRVICATNRDLKQMVRQGTFRADLYFRLNVIRIEVPPLKERQEDILPLARHFLQRQAQLYAEPVKELTPEAEQILLDYEWPGNVRELANAMEYAHITSLVNRIAPSSLPEDILAGDFLLPILDDDFLSFMQLQKRLVISALQKTKGKKMEAARLLDIDHRKLDKLVEKFNLQPTWK